MYICISLCCLLGYYGCKTHERTSATSKYNIGKLHVGTQSSLFLITQLEFLSPIMQQRTKKPVLH